MHRAAPQLETIEDIVVSSVRKYSCPCKVKPSYAEATGDLVLSWEGRRTGRVATAGLALEIITAHPAGKRF